MTRIERLTPAHVESAPEQLAAGILYISHRYNTALHLCCCGCGAEVVTPLNPAKWTLTEHGAVVSLYPSIGNWSLPCRSHYWIEDGKVRWSYEFTDAQIRGVKARDLQDVVRHVGRESEPPKAPIPSRGLLDALLANIKRWLGW